MGTSKKAVAAGHICLDITPAFPHKAVKNIEQVLSPGKLVHVKGIDIHPGGSVANTGLAMKVLGADVSLMGKVGDDEFGRLVSDFLEKYDAGDGLIVSKGEDTAYSIVLAVPGLDRIFLHNPGANDTFAYDDIQWDTVSRASLFHFGYPTQMKGLYQDKGRELVRIFKKVKEGGTAVSLDMAAIDEASAAASADWKEILKNLLPYVDFFVPSAEELCFMLDRDRYRRWMEEARGKDVTDVITMEDIQFLGQRAMDYGARVVLIKCGAPGIYFRTAPETEMTELCTKLNLSVKSWAGKEGFESSYEPDAVISGTGAGDTCIAAFLSSVLNEDPLEEALHLAAAAGACCVASYDALSGLKSMEEMKERIAKGWKKTNNREVR
ncbi:MAG: carbohydrate kinase family protein [Eubacteriales bacterium]|nr:carbohydrate kinase family protein [Eubacteriales bacterium]